MKVKVEAQKKSKTWVAHDVPNSEIKSEFLALSPNSPSNAATLYDNNINKLILASTPLGTHIFVVFRDASYRHQAVQHKMCTTPHATNYIWKSTDADSFKSLQKDWVDTHDEMNVKTFNEAQQGQKRASHGIHKSSRKGGNQSCVELERAHQTSLEQQKQEHAAKMHRLKQEHATKSLNLELEHTAKINRLEQEQECLLRFSASFFCLP